MHINYKYGKLAIISRDMKFHYAAMNNEDFQKVTFERIYLDQNSRKGRMFNVDEHEPLFKTTIYASFPFLYEYMNNLESHWNILDVGLHTMNGI